MTVVLVLCSWAALALFGGLVMSAIGRAASSGDDLGPTARGPLTSLTAHGDSPRTAGSPPGELLS
jgi:hypothetical protein